MNDGTSFSDISEAAPLMDKRLLGAAITGDTTVMLHLADHEPEVLRGITPQWNTSLHIASIHGHQAFCEGVLMMPDQYRLPLVKAINADGETPLLTAVTRGRTTLASRFLSFCHEQQLRGTILKQDKRGFNALHHAICTGQRELALKLIQAQPALSEAVNNNNESPMYTAVMRNYGDALEKLLDISTAAHGGARRYNALHAAVTSGNAAIAKRVMEARPGLAREENEDKHTPMHLAVTENKIDVLTVLLQCDPSLGYLISSYGNPLLCTAAIEGNVGAARELLRHCPDAPYYHRHDTGLCVHEHDTGLTCLHIAVLIGEGDFVRFVMRSPQLQHLITMPNDRGETALQLAQRTMQEDKREKMQKIMKNMVSVLQIYAQRIAPGMDELLKATVLGHVAQMRHLSLHVPGVLLETTPQGNTCLHIAAIHGHQKFCEEVLALEPSLLAAINSDGETPLIAAVASGHVSVASFLLSCYSDQSEMIQKQDKRGYNALHHAIRSGHRELALKLIEKRPALSNAVNHYGESPMYVAVMRNYPEVFDKLLEIADSAHGGAGGRNALHAAVRNGNSDIAEKILEKRPWLAREKDKRESTPIELAVIWGKVDVLKAFLKHDRSLGYIVPPQSPPLLVSAAFRGQVDVARELLEHCPDAQSYHTCGSTCLQNAVRSEQTEFVKFVLDSPHLRRIVNMQEPDGNTALHVAVQKCNPEMVAALLRHQYIDVAVLNDEFSPASWALPKDDLIKTLNWNEVYMRMIKADSSQERPVFHLLDKEAKDKVIDSSRKNIKTLTQTYTSNTSLVAILITTITFAAAFTLPGGYSTAEGNEGHPFMARKFAFKAFLISDTLAMCSSFVVAFVCIISRWEDLEFLLHYRSFTKKLMWFAYTATTTAFATGLYTVLTPHHLWLAVVICILTSLLPLLTMLLGKWPIWKLQFRLGRTFKSKLLDML